MCPAAMLIAASAATAAARPAIFAARGHESVPRLPRSSADVPYGCVPCARQAGVISPDMDPPFILLVQRCSPGPRVTYPYPVTPHRYRYVRKTSVLFRAAGDAESGTYDLLMMGPAGGSGTLN
jgi:hypothetical protein